MALAQALAHVLGRWLTEMSVTADTVTALVTALQRHAAADGDVAVRAAAQAALAVWRRAGFEP